MEVFGASAFSRVRDYGATGKCLIFRGLRRKPAIFNPFIAFKGLISSRLRQMRGIILWEIIGDSSPRLLPFERVLKRV